MHQITQFETWNIEVLEEIMGSSQHDVGIMGKDILNMTLFVQKLKPSSWNWKATEIVQNEVKPRDWEMLLVVDLIGDYYPE